MADPSWYVPRAAFQRRSPANESVVRLTVTVSGRRDERDVIPRARRRGPIQSAYPFIARHLRRPASGILDWIFRHRGQRRLTGLDFLGYQSRGGGGRIVRWGRRFVGSADPARSFDFSAPHGASSTQRQASNSCSIPAARSMAGRASCWKRRRTSPRWCWRSSVRWDARRSSRASGAMARRRSSGPAGPSARCASASSGSLSPTLQFSSREESVHSRTPVLLRFRRGAALGDRHGEVAGAGEDRKR